MFGSLLLKCDQNACESLLVGYRVALASVGGDVVDILDEDDVGINLVQIGNKRSVTCGTEE